MNGLNWGIAALHEDDGAAAKKEKIVKAFAADPIAFLSGKVSHSRKTFLFVSNFANRH